MQSVTTRNQIAKLLEIEATEIVEIREWAWVYWVQVAGRRPTMISKKAVQSAPKVHRLVTFGIVAEFEVLPHCVRIAYMDSRKTQYEVTTLPVARRRWRTLQQRGFMQAA